MGDPRERPGGSGKTPGGSRGVGSPPETKKGYCCAFLLYSRRTADQSSLNGQLSTQNATNQVRNSLRHRLDTIGYCFPDLAGRLPADHGGAGKSPQTVPPPTTSMALSVPSSLTCCSAPSWLGRGISLFPSAVLSRRVRCVISPNPTQERLRNGAIPWRKRAAAQIEAIIAIATAETREKLLCARAMMTL